MNFKIILVFFVCLIITQLQAIPLKDALAQNKATILAKWNSGVELTIKNISQGKIEINVPAGSHFNCDDAGAQDMIAMKSYSYTILAGKSSTKTLQVHCMEKHDYGPHYETSFTYMGDANIRLVTVAKMTDLSDKYFGISQSFIWALAEKEQEFLYSKGDSIAYWPLLNAVSPFIKLVKYSKADIEKSVYVPVTRITYSSRVNISAYIKPNTKITLTGTDRNGNGLKEYYKDKPVAAGFYNVTIGFNEIVNDSAFSLTYTLKDDKGNVLVEKKVANNKMEPAEKVYWLQTAWQMNNENPVPKASMKLYGPDNKLLIVLYENKDIPAGIRSTPYGFYHTYGKASKFKVRLTDQKGIVVNEVDVDGSGSVEKVVEMRKIKE